MSIRERKGCLSEKALIAIIENSLKEYITYTFYSILEKFIKR